MLKQFIYICVSLILIISLILNSSAANDVTVTIETQKDKFDCGEPINITVKIENNGQEKIYMAGFCYIFHVTIINEGTTHLLFCQFNNSMAIVNPGVSWEQTVNIFEFSNIDDNKTLKSLPNGTYSIQALYGSEENPWYDPTNMPYLETESNVLEITIGQETPPDSSTDVFLSIGLGIIIIIAVVSVFILLRKTMKK